MLKTAMTWAGKNSRKIHGVECQENYTDRLVRKKMKI